MSAIESAGQCFRRVGCAMNLGGGLLSLRNKCNHEFGNPNYGNRCDSAVVAFISQTSSKLRRNSPAAERHLILARLFKAGSTNAYPFSVAERRLIPMIGNNRRCGDTNNHITARHAVRTLAD